MPVCTFGGRKYRQLTGCKGNCKNLATALEMYASDNGGSYPPRLTHLIRGRYLKRVPTCPAVGTDSYSDSYSAEPDVFSFCCQGDNHKSCYDGNSCNYPRYHADFGLIDGPPER